MKKSCEQRLPEIILVTKTPDNLIDDAPGNPVKCGPDSEPSPCNPKCGPIIRCAPGGGGGPCNPECEVLCEPSLED